MEYLHFSSDGYYFDNQCVNNDNYYVCSRNDNSRERNSGKMCIETDF